MKHLIKYCGGCIVQLLLVTMAGAQTGITRIEYYIDRDPGYGKGKSVNFTAGTDLSNVTLNINPSTLSTRVHVLGIRARDASGAWSADNKWLFAKPYPATAKPGTAPNIKAVEYYIDQDPGYGKGIPVAISAANSLANINLVVNVSGLTAGDHTLFVRSQDVKNSWSLDNVFTFSVDTAVPSPSIVVTGIARKKLCQQDSVDVSYQAAGNFRPGNIFNVVLSDPAGEFRTRTIIGSYTGTGNSIIKCSIPAGLTAGTQYKIRIESTSPVITGLTAIDSIKISTLPLPVITPADTITIAQGDSIKLATTAKYKSYLWSNAAKTSTIEANTFGSYTVKVTDNNGCSAISAPVLVNVTPVITLSGPAARLCPGIPVTLISSPANNYLWNTGDTTQSITTNAGGSYYVVVNGGGQGNTSAAVDVSYRSCGNPGTLSSSDITPVSATLSWGKVSCAQNYEVRYRPSGTIAWSTLSTNDIAGFYSLGGLSASTTYEWQVRTVCSDSFSIAGKYSSIDSFTTSNAGFAASALRPSPGFTATLYPNPAAHNATLQVTGSNKKVSVVITDIAGKVLWRGDKINPSTSLPVDAFSAGTYLVIIKDNVHRQILKLVKK